MDFLQIFQSVLVLQKESQKKSFWLIASMLCLNFRALFALKFVDISPYFMARNSNTTWKLSILLISYLGCTVEIKEKS